MIGTTTDRQFVELFGSAFDNRDLGDLIDDHCLTPCRSVRRFRYGNIDQTRRPVCAGLDHDRGQTVENQLQPLQEAAGRLGWTVVAIYRDEGISGTKGRDKRPGLDAC